MFTWALIVTTIVLTLAHSWWWLIVTVLLSAFKANKWWYYKSRPWRRIHFPVMRYYAAASGTESVEAQNDGREFNIRNALINLHNSLQPELGNVDADADNFVDVVIEKCKNYSDEKLIRDTFKKRNTELSGNEFNELMSTLNESIIRTNNSWHVCIFIAEIIEQQYGVNDRGEYIVSCIEGDAK